MDGKVAFHGIPFWIKFNLIPSCHVTCVLATLIYTAVTLILHVLFCTTEEDPIELETSCWLKTAYHVSLLHSSISPIAISNVVMNLYSFIKILYALPEKKSEVSDTSNTELGKLVLGHVNNIHYYFSSVCSVGMRSTSHKWHTHISINWFLIFENLHY